MNLNKSIPIWRDANALLIAVENAVRHFPRYHKYTLGSEMRLKAMQICRLIAYAWQNKARFFCRDRSRPVPTKKLFRHETSIAHGMTIHACRFARNHDETP